MEVTKILAKLKHIRKQVKLFLKEKKDSYNHDYFIYKNPLALIIGTICNERINYEQARDIPKELYEWLKQEGLEFKASTIYSLGKDKLKERLTSYMKDKWPKKLSKKDREDWLEKISECIIDSCRKIQEEYDDEPDNIFIVDNGQLSPPLIYLILRQFPGIGPKKATMIAKDFGIEGPSFRGVKARLEKKGINLRITRRHFTEIPIDVHVRRVFQRLGFSRYFRYINPQDYQNLARIIWPKNPGLVDEFIWHLGRKRCREYSPLCEECCLESICEYQSSRGGREKPKRLYER